MVVFKGAPVDFKQFSIKPSDIGYETETAAEMTPTAIQAYGRTASRQPSGNTRPPIMIYPGE